MTAHRHFLVTPDLCEGECLLLKPEVEVSCPNDVIVIQDHLHLALLGVEVLAHDLVVAVNPGLVQVAGSRPKFLALDISFRIHEAGNSSRYKFDITFSRSR